MKKRGLIALIIGCMAGLLLTGCAKFPEMTEEEYDQTVQYAVSLLMKYSNNGVEKLSSLSALELEKQMRKEEREARKAERDAITAAAIENMPVETDESEAEDSSEQSYEDIGMNMAPDITDVAEAPAEDETESTETTDDSGVADTSEPEAESISTEETDTAPDSGDDIDELLNKYGDALDQGIENSGLVTETDNVDETQVSEEPVQETTPEPAAESDQPSTEADRTVEGMRQELSKGIFLTYSGYSVAASYPDNDDVFVINATQGKKLLILNFRLANTSGMDVSVDMEKANPHFQVVLNGKNVGYTNVTMLENDLSSFKGTIPAGAKLSMVLIKQMDASKVKNVDTLGLIGDMGTETIEFMLE